MLWTVTGASLPSAVSPRDSSRSVLRGNRAVAGERTVSSKCAAIPMISVLRRELTGIAQAQLRSGCRNRLTSDQDSADLALDRCRRIGPAGQTAGNGDDPPVLVETQRHREFDPHAVVAAPPCRRGDHMTFRQLDPEDRPRGNVPQSLDERSE